MANDLVAYASLFAPDATIVVGDGGPLDKATWVNSLSQEFAGPRETNFLNVFAGAVMAAGKPSTRVLFVERVRWCRPGLSECFPTYRTETVTVTDGKIVRLERASDFSHRQTPEGQWIFLE